MLLPLPSLNSLCNHSGSDSSTERAEVVRSRVVRKLHIYLSRSLGSNFSCFPQERVPSGCIYRPSELQVVPPVLVTTRGRGATRGAMAQNESAAMEVAAQRAREEADR